MSDTNTMNNNEETFDDSVKETTKQYEVVLYTRYGLEKGLARPTVEEITKFFESYGDVDHVVYPEDNPVAFVFMTKLNTVVEHRRVRTVIDEIIKSMTPETKFYVNVASSKRPFPRKEDNNYQPRYDNRNYQQGYNNGNYQQGYNNGNYQGNNYRPRGGYHQRNNFVEEPVRQYNNYRGRGGFQQRNNNYRPRENQEVVNEDEFTRRPRNNNSYFENKNLEK